ncbi:hypothetical protein CK203_092243 [Vitis vinifera]|uniref:Uncharacterized protein n=1 Tax=Vitis vinifera TaxID=29760 RepID=A0A438F8H1_VITVI|nr:hypothetical protein CK203_092243 [Vitis vinifera]
MKHITINYISSSVCEGRELGGKIHLVKWEVVCTDKNKGGLGLRKIVMLNKALLGKWIWRYACEKDNLWKQVITTKYGQEDLGWRSKKANGEVGVGVWKEILKEFDCMGNQQIIFSSLFLDDWVVAQGDSFVASCEHRSNSGCVVGEEREDFEDKAKNSEYLWDSIVFLASLWAFCSKVFKGTPFNVL